MSLKPDSRLFKEDLDLLKESNESLLNRAYGEIVRFQHNEIVWATKVDELAQLIQHQRSLIPIKDEPLKDETGSGTVISGSISPPPLCTNCKYINLNWEHKNWEDQHKFAHCLRTITSGESKVDLITGTTEFVQKEGHYCSVERAGYTSNCCGTTGRHFEKKA